MGRRRNPTAWAVVALFSLAVVGCGRPVYPTAAPMARWAAPQAPVSSLAGKPVQPEPQKEQLLVSGVVTEVLPADTDDRPHQLFIIKVAGKLIKVAHNTGLAPSVPLQVGSALEIKGEYLHTQPMPVLHWTHLDPGHKHEDGYILFNGRKYQ
ncbi:MAG: DUF3465 domain-containing protein [Candidatus Sericytochromatia bacterium]|nr:DUF3465 domain-containing protein [Candidatus Sericytochromatia bacterium]